MVRINFIGTDDLNGIEEEKGSSQLLNINPDGKKDHPLQRQSGEVSDAQRPPTDVCEVSSSLINSVILGDCLEKVKDLPDDSVDLIVTDPPYGIDFMGNDWDKAVPTVEIWKECLRVLKPGAFAFIMSSPRLDVLSRNVLNLESAGFKSNFTPLYWTYAKGIPKGQNIGKLIDKKLGAKRKILGRNPNSRETCDKSNTVYRSGTVGKTAYITEPASEEANKLNGSYTGYQPRPLVEVIIVVMKPLDEKSYTDQALSNGKGVTWLDDCRIPYRDEKIWSADCGIQWSPERKWNSDYHRGGDPRGRLPANMIASDRILGNHSKYFDLDAWAERNLPFLIVPKASKKETNTGMNEFKAEKNSHPTVKPIKLMTYLITMGSREGDVVLDPFCGSGTTCMAAKMLKRRYIGMELSPEYREIAMKRIENVEPTGGERQLDKGIRGPIIRNLQFIVGQQLRKNPIGVKIALKYYVNKVSEIKRRYSVVDIFEDNEKGTSKMILRTFSERKPDDSLSQSKMVQAAQGLKSRSE